MPDEEIPLARGLLPVLDHPEAVACAGFEPHNHVARAHFIAFFDEFFQNAAADPRAGVDVNTFDPAGNAERAVV